MSHQPEIAFYHSGRNRSHLCLANLIFFVLPFIIFLQGLMKLLDPPRGADPGEAISRIFLAGVPAALFLAAAIFMALQGGRLRFSADRVELPRLPIPPMCFFAPIRIDYAEVVRWGVAQTGPDKLGIFHTIIVLVVSSPDGDLNRVRKFPITYYADPNRIVSEFAARLPRSRSKVHFGEFLGGVSFE